MYTFISDLPSTVCLYLTFPRVKESTKDSDRFRESIKDLESFDNLILGTLESKQAGLISTIFNCWLFDTYTRICDKRLLNVFYSKEELSIYFQRFLKAL